MNDDDYQIWATTSVRNVPSEVVKSFVNAFMDDAALNMSNDFSKEELDRVVYFVMKDYPDLPIAYVRSALYRGSLGKFGPGRLVPRVVFNWLAEVQNEYTRDKDHKERDAYLKAPSRPINLYQQPVGKAIMKKAEWLKSGKITSEEYDRIDIFALSKMIVNDHIDLTLFGIHEKRR